MSTVAASPSPAQDTGLGSPRTRPSRTASGVRCGVNQHYGSWAEYGAAYFIGRCMGLDEDTPSQAFAEAVETLRELLNNPESPWVKLPWHTGAPA